MFSFFYLATCLFFLFLLPLLLFIFLYPFLYFFSAPILFILHLSYLLLLFCLLIFLFVFSYLSFSLSFMSSLLFLLFFLISFYLSLFSSSLLNYQWCQDRNLPLAIFCLSREIEIPCRYIEKLSTCYTKSPRSHPRYSTTKFYSVH